MLTPQSKPQVKPNIVGRIIEDEAVIVLPEQGKVKVLNEVGALIWEQADGSKTVEQIAEHICAEFEIDLAQATQDVIDFIQELEALEIVSIL